MAQWPAFSDNSQPGGCVERTGKAIRLGGAQSPHSPTSGVRRQGRRSLEKRSGGGESAPRLRSPGRCFQLSRDSLIGTDGCPGPVPRSAIRIGVPVTGLGQRAMGLSPASRSCRVVDGGPNQRMTKYNPIAKLDKPVIFKSLRYRERVPMGFGYEAIHHRVVESSRDGGSGVSSHCASSITHSTGRFALRIDRRLSSPSPTSSRSGTFPVILPRAILIARRCGCGSCSISSVSDRKNS